MNEYHKSLAAITSEGLQLDIIENSTDAIIITSVSGTILYVNKQFTVLTGYEKEEAVGKTPAILKSGIQDDAFYERLWLDLSENKRWESHLWNKRKDGKLFFEHQTIVGYTNDDGELTHYIATFKDCTQQLDDNRQKEYQDYYDHLTSLPNRKRLLQYMSQKIHDSNDFSVIAVQISHLSKINSNYGMSFGDQYIQNIAMRLTNLGEIKHFIARSGGDKFIIVTPRALLGEQGHKTLNQIVDYIESPMVIDDVHLLPFTEMGITHFPTHADTASQLLEYADIAMYCKKQHSLNSCANTAEKNMNNEQEEFLLAQKIKIALKNNDFEIFYQPQFNINSREVVGAEALIRWRKDGQYIPPNVFLATAEKYQLIKSIDLYVFEKVMKDISLASLQGDFLPKISINLAESLIPIPTIIALMEQYRILGEQVEIELTEGLTSQDSSTFIEYIGSLNNLGISTAIDDFGTGYSSLARLKTIPFNKLKIDKQFVDEIVSNEKELKVLKAIVDIGNVLDKVIIVEGVETIEQVELLHSFNCELIQGYYFSRALPLTDFIELNSKYS